MITSVFAQPAIAEKTPYFPDAVVQISPEDLPQPYSTPSVNNSPRVVTAPEGASFTVPQGFEVREFARDFDTPRIIEVAPNGDIFVVESRGGRVTVLRDADNDGEPELRETFLEDLNMPYGLAIGLGHVFIGETTQVIRVPYTAGDLQAQAAPEVIVPDLPGGGYNQHWTRSLALDASNEWLYTGVGSRTNVDPEEPPRACVLRCRPDGSESEIFARGLRNPAGIRVQPRTHELWAAVNERDGLGDDLVPDYLTHVERGGFYGWPFLYIGTNADPRLAEEASTRLMAPALVPDLLIQSHSAALGFEFYTGTMFPEEVRGDAFVALHGSWNRSQRTGYSVIRVPFGPDGRTLGWYEHLMRGFLIDPGQRGVWGRPVDVAVAQDGALLITDDGGNKIWRMTYQAP